MNTKSNLPPELIALLSGALSGITGAAFIEITPRDGQSLDDAIEEAAAKHREGCAECSAEHAAEQAAAKVHAEFEAKAKSQAQAGNAAGSASTGNSGSTAQSDTRMTGASEAFGAPYGLTPDRKPIGFMLFAQKPDTTEPARAMPSSFRASRASVEELLAKFEQSSTHFMMTMVGSAPIFTIRPVFTE